MSMAERVVPVLTPERVQSRPERIRGRHTRRIRRLVATSLVLVAAVAVVVVTLHFLVIDHASRTIRPTALIPEGSPARVLVVVAHPGDELELAGTIAALTASGATVTELSLTSGEARPPQEATTAGTEFGEVRGDEFQRAGELLGVRRATALGNADGSLLSGDPAAIAGQIAAAAAKAKPSVILTVGDLGTPDSDGQAVLALAVRAAQASGSSVARVWQATRGAREAQWLNRAFGPAINEAALAPTDVAIRIDGTGQAKTGVLLAHGTQSPQLGRGYPLADAIPAELYFRFLNREYLHLAWGQPIG